MEFVAYDPSTGGFGTTQKRGRHKTTVPKPLQNNAAEITAPALPAATHTLEPTLQSPAIVPPTSAPATVLPEAATDIPPCVSAAETPSDMVGVSRSTTPVAPLVVPTELTVVASEGVSATTEPATCPPSLPAGGVDNDKDDKEDDWEDVDEDGSSPSERPGVSTWCQRNPDKPVIPLRRGRKKPDTEMCATAKLRWSNNQEARKLLQVDIDEINAVRNKMAEEVVEKHHVKVDLVLQRLMALSSFKPKRAVNLFNAKVHHLSKRRKSYFHKDVKRRVLSEPEFQDPSPAEESAMCAELANDCEIPHTGARATNEALSADARATVGRIADEMNALIERTGMVCVAFFSRGHIHDKTVPTEVGTWDGLNFFPNVVGSEARDLATQFELWCVAWDNGLNTVDTLKSMRKEITKYVGTDLKAKKGKKITVNWLQYWKVMVLKHGVRLMGWPLDGDPVNPNTIHDVDSIRKVRNAMKNGTCFWHKLDDDEKAEAEEEYKDLLEHGLVVEVTRKEQSDKKQPRKKSKETEALATRSKAKGAKKRCVWEEVDTDEEDEPKPKKKRRTAEGEGRTRKSSRDAGENRRPKKCKASAGDEDRQMKKVKTSKSGTAGNRSSGSSWRHSSKSKSVCSGAEPTKFEAMRERLKLLASLKAPSVSSQLPPAIRKGPPGIRRGEPGFDTDNDDEDKESSGSE
ncbi:hypothetical protein C8R43DRAFT_1116190 [Mycena crocata]|nr:hypothetical protein C8R43DRAFT_1116190 [Mycena crocata]